MEIKKYDTEKYLKMIEDYKKIEKKIEDIKVLGFEKQIEKDKNRTFGYFISEFKNEFLEELSLLLRVYSYNNNDISYLQGMNFLMAFVMVSQDFVGKLGKFLDDDRAKVLQVFSVVMDKFMYKQVQNFSYCFMMDYQIKCMIEFYLPHFFDIGDLNPITLNWFLTLFTAVDIKEQYHEVFYHIFDIILAQGYKGILKIVLSMFEFVRNHYVSKDFENETYDLKGFLEQQQKYKNDTYKAPKTTKIKKNDNTEEEKSESPSSFELIFAEDQVPDDKIMESPENKIMEMELPDDKIMEVPYDDKFKYLDDIGDQLKQDVTSFEISKALMRYMENDFNLLKTCEKQNIHLKCCLRQYQYSKK